MAAARQYEFHGFRVDLQQRQLWDPHGQPVDLPARAFDTLVYLLEHHGRDVRKDDLLRAVWPDTVVEENNLNQCISALRRAFGDRRNAPRFVRTIPGRGYRFIAELGPPSELGDLHPAPPLRPRGRYMGIGIAALGAAALALAAVSTWRERAPATAGAPLATVAVLPFTPLAAEQGSPAMELGMAETLIGRISALPGIVVLPVGAVRRYAVPEQDPLLAGRDLGADAVLAASIQTDADRIRVVARLLRVTDGQSLWSGRFDSEFSSIFDVQDTIAEMVMETLAGELGATAPPKRRARATQNAEAYRWYLDGVYNRQRHDLRAAAESFRAAVAADPGYAIAWSALSAMLGALGAFHMEPAAEVFPEARAAALRAIELDPGLADAHGALGHVLVEYEARYVEGDALYRKARELDPDSALIRLWTSINYLYLGRDSEALEQARIAQALEPGTLPYAVNVGMVLYYAGMYEEAVVELRRVLALAPAFDHAHSVLGRALLELGEFETALEHFRARRGPTPTSLADLGRAHAKRGRYDEAQAEIARLRQLGREGFDVAFDIAAVYALLGDTERACAELAAALHVSSITWGLLRLDPAFAALRAEPCFEPIARDAPGAASRSSAG